MPTVTVFKPVRVGIGFVLLGRGKYLGYGITGYVYPIMPDIVAYSIRNSCYCGSAPARVNSYIRRTLEMVLSRSNWHLLFRLLLFRQ